MVSQFAIEVRNLTYKFKESSDPSVVDINLQIPWNTRSLVVGANGAGKSTLLKLLSGTRTYIKQVLHTFRNLTLKNLQTPVYSYPHLLNRENLQIPSLLQPHR